MKIGFLGLGTMGRAMAANLVRAGHEVHVWNRSAGPAQDLARSGAIAAPDARAAASAADILLSMLADDAATQAVLLQAGALDALKPGAIHANMATVSVACARDLARQHHARSLGYIAAPVLGRVTVAEAGQLNILAAGDEAALDHVQPLFDILGHQTWRLGHLPEQANAVKLAVNSMIATAIASMGEGVALAGGYGIASETFIDLITTTLFSSPVYKGYGAAIAGQCFEPAGFKLALGLKDVRLTMEAAEMVRVPTPLASLLRDQHLDNLAHGEGHLDWAALARVAARRAGQTGD